MVDPYPVANIIRALKAGDSVQRRIVQRVIDVTNDGGDVYAARILAEALASLPPPDAVNPDEAEKAGETEEVFYPRPAKRMLGSLAYCARTSAEVFALVKELEGYQLLRKHGVRETRRILLHGKPGTGKTVLTEAIAHELNLPLFVADMAAISSKYLGSTGKQVRKAFEEVKSRRAVFLFDEFDAIAADRESFDSCGSSGEMRRAVNLLLQYMEDDGDGIMVATTNTPQSLDRALWRRFDTVIEVPMPGVPELARAAREAIRALDCTTINWEAAVAGLAGVASPADVVSAVQRLEKHALLDGADAVTQAALTECLRAMPGRLDVRRTSHLSHVM